MLIGENACFARVFKANRGTSPSLPGRSLPQRDIAPYPPAFRRVELENR
nr:MAG TPA: hypothetical protein [Caudoviricetes sp.]